MVPWVFKMQESRARRCPCDLHIARTPPKKQRWVGEFFAAAETGEDRRSSVPPNETH